MLRDTLLNGAVLLSLVVGVGGALSGAQPWRWLGPVIGVTGVVLSFAAHRERVVRTSDGDLRASLLLPGHAVWATAIGVPLACLGAVWAMWT